MFLGEIKLLNSVNYIRPPAGGNRVKLSSMIWHYVWSGKYVVASHRSGPTIDSVSQKSLENSNTTLKRLIIL
jgi:hypothetical protein